MVKMEGRLLNLGTVDSCGRKFAENCKITFSNKVPVYWNFDRDNPRSVIGNANIFRDDKGLACKVNLTTEQSMSIVLGPSDKGLKIRKEYNNA